MSANGRRPSTVLAASAAACLALLTLGFITFANWTCRQAEPRATMADGIVVLTGPERRIETGLELLRRGLGRRLLISGVNPKTSPQEFVRIAGLGNAISARIDLGYTAQDTAGNADETRAWAARHRFRRLIVVTSSWHMPRSMSELSRALPDVELVAWPVVPRALREEAWWLRLSTTRMLAAEYLKLLPSAARYAASRLLRPLEASAAPGAS